MSLDLFGNSYLWLGFGIFWWEFHFSLGYYAALLWSFASVTLLCFVLKISLWEALLVVWQGLFGKRFLVTLFKFSENMCERKKCVKIHGVMFKQQFSLFKHYYQTGPHYLIWVVRFVLCLDDCRLFCM